MSDKPSLSACGPSRGELAEIARPAVERMRRLLAAGRDIWSGEKLPSAIRAQIADDMKYEIVGSELREAMRESVARSAGGGKTG